MLKPGSRISGGQRRDGTVLAFFRSNSNEIYLASAGHVIKKEHDHPASTTIFQNDASVATYRRGEPVKKLLHVDFLIAKVKDDCEWSNQLPSMDSDIANIIYPVVGQTLKMHAGHTSTSGTVVEIDPSIPYKYCFLIRWSGTSPQPGDSGAPWYSENGELAGMHLGAMPGDASLMRAVYLTKIITHYDIKLA